jgi:hypothetical protein
MLTRDLLGNMYDDLLEVVHQHPGAAAVMSAVGAVEDTYDVDRCMSITPQPYQV